MDAQLEQAQKSGKWFAPSMFITTYGRFGVKIEVSAFRHIKGNIETWGCNIDGSSYWDAKKKFWELWNKEHKGEYLSIFKAVGAYGL